MTTNMAKSTCPDKLFDIKSDVRILMTAMRCGVRRSWHSSQDEEQDALLKSLTTLKKDLNSAKSLSELDPGLFIAPFLEIIQSEKTTGPVTTIALTTIYKIISNGLIDSNHPDAATCVEAIADTVINTKFIRTDDSEDGIVFRKILRTLKTLVLSSLGDSLSNESVCEIMLYFFKSCFDIRFNDEWRTTAEDYLQDIVQHLFIRLPMFADDSSDIKTMITNNLKKKKSHSKKSKINLKPKSNLNNSGIENPEIQASSSVEKLKTDDTANNSISLENKQDSSIHFVQDKVDITSVALNEKDETLTYESKEQKSENENLIDPNSNEQLISPTEENKSFIETAEINQINNFSSEAPTELNVVKNQDNYNSDDNQFVQSPAGSIENLSLLDDSKCVESPTKTDGQPMTEFVNSQGIRFMAVREHTPYGSLCIRELFRYLCSLCNPHDKQNTEIMIHLSLSLLQVALREAAGVLDNFPSLLKLVKDDLTKSLILLLGSDKLPIFTVNLEVAFLLFNSQREHLKFQLEQFIVKLMDLLNVSDPNKVSYELQELALETIVELWKIPGLPTELFVNYDCGLYSANLYEDLLKILSKKLVGDVNSMQFISLDAIFSLIAEVEERCNQFALGVSKEGVVNNLSILELIETKAKKRMLNIGSEKFNENPKVGIAQLTDDGLLGGNGISDPNEIAKFLRENPTIDKKAIGEYISKKDNTDILRSFVHSFDYKNTRIDQALRQYLETFRLPGEAPLIFYLLEQFAEHWSDSNDKPFASVDAAFSLSYAIIMLNVDQHNHNIKRQNIPMTAEDFKKNLRGLNGDADFDQDMLDEIYSAIKNEEIIMPAERTGIVKENYLWKCLLRRGESPESIYKKVSDYSELLNRELVQRAWTSIVNVLCKAFDKTLDNELQSRVADSFLSLAAISDHYNMTSDMDTLIVNLYKFTGLGSLVPGVRPLQIILKLGSSEKCQIATMTLFKICLSHGNALRASWKIIIDCLQTLYKLKLLPPNTIVGEDFVEPSGRVALIKEPATPKTPPVEQGILSSLFSYIAPDPSRVPHPGEDEAKKQALECVAGCRVNEIIDKSRSFKEESLCFLVNALISSDPNDESSRNEDASENERISVFLLEVLVNICVNNSGRIGCFWPDVKEHLDYLLTIAIQENQPYLVERVTVSLLRLAIVVRGEKILSEILLLLEPLTRLPSASAAALSRQISYGLCELLKVAAANIHSTEDWKIVFNLLECTGVGGIQSKPVPNAVLDETNQRKSPVPESESPHAAAHSLPQPATTPPRRAESPLPVTANAIVLDRDLLSHDPLALIKCCESLIFLIRDVAHVTPFNIELCVRCVRTFAEAVTCSIDKRSRVNRMIKEPPAYHQAPLQLIELMHTLHTKAPQILSSWMNESSDESNPVAKISLWSHVWQPLLQGKARLCCDSRKTVRTAAIASLQSTLLSSYLNQLTAFEWSECLQLVLFPLLTQLLRPIAKDDPLALEDTRFRAAMLLSKVFLRHLHLLISLNDFLPLWLTVLDLLRAYALADNSENLYEAIPESLKNMLLVMASVGVLQPDSYLWTPTWRAIYTFLPTLKNELFPEPSQPPQVSPQACPSPPPLPPSPPLSQSPVNQGILSLPVGHQETYPYPIPPLQAHLEQQQLSSPMSQSPVSDSGMSRGYSPRLEEYAVQQPVTPIKEDTPNLLLNTKESEQFISLVSHQPPSVSSPVSVQPSEFVCSPVVQEQQQPYQVYYPHQIDLVGNDVSAKSDYVYLPQMQNFNPAAYTEQFKSTNQSEMQIPTGENPVIFNSAAYFNEDPAADRLFAVIN